MRKSTDSTVLVFVIFTVILGFLLLNSFILSMRPKIIVTPPKVIIERPTKTIVRYKIVKITTTLPLHSGGLLHKLHRLF